MSRGPFHVPHHPAADHMNTVQDEQVVKHQTNKRTVSDWSVHRLFARGKLNTTVKRATHAAHLIEHQRVDGVYVFLL